MKKPINTTEYGKLSIQELLNIVFTDFHAGMKETFATVQLQLEIAHKLEPEEEELDYAQASLKEIREKFTEHIQKEEHLLFPLLSVTHKRQNKSEEREDVGAFVSELKAEHNQLRIRLKQLGKATHHYNCEPSATPSHKLAYALLNDLEQDFNRLFFVEEEFLFPRLLRIYHNQ